MKWIVPTFPSSPAASSSFSSSPTSDLYRFTDPPPANGRDREVMLHKSLAIIMATIGRRTGLIKTFKGRRHAPRCQNPRH